MEHKGDCMKIGLRLAAIAATTLIAVLALAGDKERDLDVLAFPTMSASFRPPYDFWLVSVRNPGPDTRGALEVKRGSFRSTLTIDMPHQTDLIRRKTFLVYFPDAPKNIDAAGYFRARSEDGRSATQEIKGTPGAGIDVPTTAPFSTKKLVLLQRPDGASGISENGVPSLAASNAPEIAAAYFQFSSVILSEGSQNLSDGAVDALKHYVAAGGNLIFSPSSEASAVEDPRWTGFLPARPEGGARQVDLVPLITDPEVNHATPQPQLKSIGVQLIDLKPDPLAKLWHWGKEICCAQKRIGIGSTVIPAGEFTPNTAAATSLDPVLQTDRPHFMTMDYPASIGGPDRTIFAVPAIRTQGTPSAAPTDGKRSTDPFTAKPPSLFSVVFTLLGYAVAVIVAAALGQKVFKKGEIAWITTPMLSIGFAGFFFSFAADLYRSKESREVAGLLVGDVSSGKGYVWGTCQIFLPKGGKRNLKTTDIEYLAPESRATTGLDSRTLEESTYRTLNLQQDKRGFSAPAVDADNLAFLSLRFQQRVNVKDWFHTKIKLTHKGEGLRATGSLKNDTPYSLEEVAITVGDDQFLVPNVSPHSVVNFANAPCTRFGGPSPIAQMPDFTHMKRIGLEATIIGFNPGPQAGNVLPEHQIVKLAMDLGDGGVVR